MRTERKEESDERLGRNRNVKLRGVDSPLHGEMGRYGEPVPDFYLFLSFF